MYANATLSAYFYRNNNTVKMSLICIYKYNQISSQVILFKASQPILILSPLLEIYVSAAVRT